MCDCILDVPHQPPPCGTVGVDSCISLRTRHHFVSSVHESSVATPVNSMNYVSVEKVKCVLCIICRLLSRVAVESRSSAPGGLRQVLFNDVLTVQKYISWSFFLTGFALNAHHLQLKWPRLQGKDSEWGRWKWSLIGWLPVSSNQCWCSAIQILWWLFCWKTSIQPDMFISPLKAVSLRVGTQAWFAHY